MPHAKIDLVLPGVGLLVGILAFVSDLGHCLVNGRVSAPETVEIRDGKPSTAPRVGFATARALTIMKYEVTARDYQRCVEARACMAARLAATEETDFPVVGVSWRDASAYARWLTRQTGMRFRLPTEEEWIYAAGRRFQSNIVPEAVASDPGQRALIRYEQEARRDEPLGKQPLPTGAFGANENRLFDVAGNVWEWTSTCFVRQGLNATQSQTVTGTVNCGVRVVEGRHRTYMTDFIRDARAGGCSVGTPPSNLGFRLVRDDGIWRGVRQDVSDLLALISARSRKWFRFI